MWRAAAPVDDAAMVAMCIALNAEDPGLQPVSAENMRRTLHELRQAPVRGRAMVLELDARVRGYALLVSFWSNELGGEVCTIDELYVEPAHRGSGHATRLLQGLSARSEPWLANTVALAVEATAGNVRARRLYERLGFQATRAVAQGQANARGLCVGALFSLEKHPITLQNRQDGSGA
jgi:GNAT superfamily N-acetyltransferase